jgi:hypothetical protein
LLFLANFEAFSMVHSAAVLVAEYPCVGFSGARKPSSASLAALKWLSRHVSPSASVMVGCAPGIDQAVRSAFPTAQVFEASSFGTGRGSFAARSVSCVRAVAVSGGLWVSFPAAASPVGLLPSGKSSKAFCGAGSGTWASLAFAVGCGLPCLLYLPSGISAPAGWGLQPIGDDWLQNQPPGDQLNLF